MSWSRSSCCWATPRFRPPNGTWGPSRIWFTRRTMGSNFGSRCEVYACRGIPRWNASLLPPSTRGMAEQGNLARASRRRLLAPLFEWRKTKSRPGPERSLVREAQPAAAVEEADKITGDTSPRKNTPSWRGGGVFSAQTHSTVQVPIRRDVQKPFRSPTTEAKSQPSEVSARPRRSLRARHPPCQDSMEL